MADVFISYKSEDRAAARLYADALAAEGFSVWWDPVLRTGETYDEVIERNLREAALVVVLWSTRSVKSKWVRAEATIGERKGGLMPVLIEACDRPIAFELTQTADLVGWTGDRSHARWREFVADMRDALSTHQAEVRARTAPPPPDPLTIETLFWSSIKDGNDAADFEAYLSRYPHGHFVELARNRLNALKRDFPPPPPRSDPLPASPFQGEEQVGADMIPPPERGRLGGGRTPRWLIPGALAALVALIGAIGVITAGPIFTDQTKDPPALPDARTSPASVRAPLKVSSDQLRDFALFRDCDECPEMVVLPAGTFLMGSPENEAGRNENEGPQREVTIASFAAGRFEVTFAEWDACVAAGGCSNYAPPDPGWGRDRRPVINVSWDDAQTYVRWLSAHTGHSYRLMSEAEWEYAARAGTTTAYWTGASISASQARFNSDSTVVVGSYAANPFGLYDMHGNVWEWVQDCYAESYAGAAPDGSVYETNNCSLRVLRGGSWDDIPQVLRSAFRFRYFPSLRLNIYGFRLARTL